MATWQEKRLLGKVVSLACPAGDCVMSLDHVMPSADGGLWIQGTQAPLGLSGAPIIGSRTAWLAHFDADGQLIAQAAQGAGSALAAVDEQRTGGGQWFIGQSEFGRFAAPAP